MSKTNIFEIAVIKRLWYTVKLISSIIDNERTNDFRGEVKWTYFTEAREAKARQ